MLHQVLWIPTMGALVNEEPPLQLTEALINKGIGAGEFFHPLPRFAQDFSFAGLRKEGRLIPVEKKHGFSFDTLCFQGCPEAKVSYTAGGTLWYQVYLRDFEKHHPEELATYFKKCWKQISPQSRPPRTFQ